MYGSYHGIEVVCGVGGLVSFSDTHHYRFNANVGRVTDYFGVFMALKTLLKIEMDLGLNHLQVNGIQNW